MSYLFQERLVLNPGFFLFTVQRSASLYTVVLFDFVIWGGEKKKSIHLHQKKKTGIITDNFVLV